jgi:hypothetical protein
LLFVVLQGYSKFETTRPCHDMPWHMKLQSQLRRRLIKLLQMDQTVR